MPSTAHPDAFHFDRPVPSYWEATAPPLDASLEHLEGDVQADIAIIGGGYTGLSCAHELACAGAGRVILLEAGEPGWGASGRNGGFSCIGAAKLPWSTMIRRYGLADTQAFFAIQREAVLGLRQTAMELGIDADVSGHGEISLAHRPNRLAELAAEAEFLRRTFDHPTELLSPAALRERGLGPSSFHGGLYNPLGYAVHPLKLVRGLAAAAIAAGAEVYSHSAVRSIVSEAGRHRLVTDRATVTAPHVVLACNGFTQEHVLPVLSGRIMPVLSNIMVTRPLTEEEREGQGWTSPLMAFDTRNLLHYFRLLPDGRFLFGGRGGTDASSAGAAPREAELRAEFEQLFPAWRHVEHTHFWRGLACLSNDLVPYLGPLDDHRSLWTALAYHGNGVAMANWSGRRLANIILGRERLQDLPSVMTRRLARYPLPALRPLYLKSAYAYFTIRDEWL
ncbi:glycine/D-amino acid oxidase-like deaminating enzyme [Rhodoligotrophos appendicifer]|uniref:NAD(P)/FAD-dependent oxidoreductase n=1 Tax=Rhodoligotrophos appendicifer TaxID=987056 RepID=UPI00118560AA|nr:FAD-binding oxidoreductase [Rhodoligotrophos appendicifer]